MDVEVRQRRGERDPRRASAGADIDDRAILDQLGRGERILDVKRPGGRRADRGQPGSRNQRLEPAGEARIAEQR